MYDAFLAQSEVDGTVWAIPDLASARALYYNKDILDAAGVEVPTTWDELKACMREAIKAYDDSIYPWGIDMTTDEGQAAFAYYTWNNGGGFVDDDGNWTLNSAAERRSNPVRNRSCKLPATPTPILLTIPVMICRICSAQARLLCSSLRTAYLHISLQAEMK